MLFTESDAGKVGSIFRRPIPRTLSRAPREVQAWKGRRREVVCPSRRWTGSWTGCLTVRILIKGCGYVCSLERTNTPPLSPSNPPLVPQFAMYPRAEFLDPGAPQAMMNPPSEVLSQLFPHQKVKTCIHVHNLSIVPSISPPLRSPHSCWVAFIISTKISLSILKTKGLLFPHQLASAPVVSPVPNDRSVCCVSSPHWPHPQNKKRPFTPLSRLLLPGW